MQVTPKVENLKYDVNCCCMKCGDTEDVVMVPFEAVPSCCGMCSNPNRVQAGCGTTCAHKCCAGPPAGSPMVIWPLPWAAGYGSFPWKAADKAAFAASLRAGMATVRTRHGIPA